MRSFLFSTNPYRASIQWAVLAGLLAFGFASCKSQNQPAQRTESRTQPNLDPGWPKGNAFYQQVSYQVVKTTLPVVPDAEYVDDDEISLLAMALMQRPLPTTFTGTASANRATVRRAAMSRPAARNPA